MEDCRSTYYALKHWNNLQRGLWQDRVCNFWTGEYLDTAKPWEIGIYERIRSKCFTLELIVERMEASE